MSSSGRNSPPALAEKVLGLLQATGQAIAIAPSFPIRKWRQEMWWGCQKCFGELLDRIEDYDT